MLSLLLNNLTLVHSLYCRYATSDRNLVKTQILNVTNKNEKFNHWLGLQKKKVPSNKHL